MLLECGSILSPACFQPETDTAQRFLASAYDAVEAVLENLEKVRELRRQETGDIRGRLTANKEDLLRAAIVFTGAIKRSRRVRPCGIAASVGEVSGKPAADPMVVLAWSHPTKAVIWWLGSRGRICRARHSSRDGSWYWVERSRPQSPQKCCPGRAVVPQRGQAKSVALTYMPPRRVCAAACTIPDWRYPVVGDWPPGLSKPAGARPGPRSKGGSCPGLLVMAQAGHGAGGRGAICISFRSHWATWSRTD
jgi:hypothetical protein